jgi:hypothetical protein
MENKIVYSAATKERTEETFESSTSINDLKTMKKQEINRDFERQIASGSVDGYLTQGLTTNFHVYDAKDDLANYQVALQSMQIQGLTERQIKVKESNPFVTVTLAELQTVLGELVVFGDNLWVRKQSKYAEIEAATDENILSVIAW